MAPVQLSLAFSTNERTQAILDGTVRPEGIDLTCTRVGMSELAWRQLRFSEFDVSEMSLSSTLIATARGDWDYVALPVFTTRRFFHTWTLIRTDVGIDRPEDMKGKRVGVPEYQQTAALWNRGVLQHEFGVAPKDMEFFMERTEEVSHGGATGFQPPPGVTVHHIPRDKSIGSMMMAGELDATLLYLPTPNLVDRSSVDLLANPKMRLLFPDTVAEGQRYYQKTGIFPINHTLIVRKSILKEYPWVAINLFNAFLAAKQIPATQVRQLTESHLLLGLLPSEARSALATDLFPYGIQSNRTILETVTQYSHEQGLTPRVLSLDEVFASSTLDL